MQKIIIPYLCAICCLLSACASTPLHLHPYQPSIQQGNVFTQQTVDQVRLGMSKDQVIEILGYPTLANDFEQNHWPYVYTFQKNGGKITTRRLDLYFSNDRLVSKNYQDNKK